MIGREGQGGHENSDLYAHKHQQTSANISPIPFPLGLFSGFNSP
jgi:hypothetical protein